MPRTTARMRFWPLALTALNRPVRRVVALSALAFAVAAPAAAEASPLVTVRDAPATNRHADERFRYRPSALPDDALLPRQWELVQAPAMGAPAAWRRGPVAPV